MKVIEDGAVRKLVTGLTLLRLYCGTMFVFLRFYRSTRMHSADYAVHRKMSVGLFV